VAQGLGRAGTCIESRGKSPIAKSALSESARNAELQRIVEAAAKLTGQSFAAISMVDTEHQWFAARVGFDADDLSYVRSFFAKAIPRREPMMVWDAQADARFSVIPLVQAKSGIRFYAGVPLFDGAGYGVAALCVAGAQPRADFPQIHELVRLAHRAERFVRADHEVRE